jgi:mannose-6-phosphate isomerase-like protein (cupin superfamily)
MKELNRREIGIALSAFAVFGGLSTEAQEPKSDAGEPVLAHSKIFSFAELVPKTGPNGMVSRQVMRGTLATGEYVEVHETMLPPGQMPHPPHRHTHSEFLLIREGRLEVMSDGQHGFVEPGGVIFTASGVLHSLKNVGDVPASYFVVGVGVQRAIA